MRKWDRQSRHCKYNQGIGKKQTDASLLRLLANRGQCAGLAGSMPKITPTQIIIQLRQQQLIYYILWYRHLSIFGKTLNIGGKEKKESPSFPFTR